MKHASEIWLGWNLNLGVRGLRSTALSVQPQRFPECIMVESLTSLSLLLLVLLVSSLV